MQATTYQRSYSLFPNNRSGWGLRRLARLGTACVVALSLSACDDSQLSGGSELQALQDAGLLNLPRANFRSLDATELSAQLTVNAVSRAAQVTQLTVNGTDYLELSVSLPKGTLNPQNNNMELLISRVGQLQETVDLVALSYSFDFDGSTVSTQTSASNYPDQDGDGVSNLVEFDTNTLDTDGDGVWNYRDETDSRDHLLPTMVDIAGNSYSMGCYPSDSNCLSNEQPLHHVSVAAFQFGETEVSFEEFDLFSNDTGAVHPNDFGYGRGQKPVIGVNWHDANRYITWLNEKTSSNYRLPTEAEFEYVLRANSTTVYPWGNTINHSVANYGAETCCEGATQDQDNWFYTAPVGSMAANNFGVHDASGNVWEWTADNWHDNYTSAPNDGSAWSYGGDSSEKVLRSGGWNSGSFALRSAFRYKLDEYSRVFASGFRLARSVDTQ